MLSGGARKFLLFGLTQRMLSPQSITKSSGPSSAPTGSRQRTLRFSTASFGAASSASQGRLVSQPQSTPTLAWDKARSRAR
eukprot:3005647-Rhodomonas_salina.1